MLCLSFLTCVVPSQLVSFPDTQYGTCMQEGLRTRLTPSQSVNVYVSAGESVLLRSDQVDGGGNVSIDMESVQRTQLQQLEQQVCRH